VATKSPGLLAAELDAADGLCATLPDGAADSTAVGVVLAAPA
jgi:hypothetical protein